MRNVLLHLMVVLSVFSVQGCWADEMGTTTSNRTKPIDSAPKEKYPPYPNVWDYVPEPGDVTPGVFWQTPSGDIAVIKETHAKTVDGKKVWLSESVGFFSGKLYSNMTEEDRVKSEFVELKPNRFRKPFKLSNGNFVLSKSLPTGAKCGNEFSNYIEISNEEHNTLHKFRLLYLPENPSLDKGSYCEGDAPRQIRVVSLHPRFIELEDDTFLAASEDIVVRFRPDFTMGSNLLNKRLFIVDLDIDPYKVLGIEFDKQHDLAADQAIWYRYLTKLREKK